MSLTVPHLPLGIPADDSSFDTVLLASRSMPSVPAIAPGAMLFAVTPNGPYSSATLAMSESMAALAAETCAWSGMPVYWNVAETDRNRPAVEPDGCGVGLPLRRAESTRYGIVALMVLK